MGSRDIMIRITDLVVQYGTYRAVDGLFLDLYRGELFGLLGPNGAGKSTTVRVLIGQRPADSGQVTVGGLDVARQWQQVKSLFGYVPDRDNHFDEFSGWRNLRIFCDLYGAPRNRVDECLQLVELTEVADLPVKSYSMGMKKKLLFGAAPLHDPAVMYLDEPTANLDIHSCAVVHRILRERVEAGRTVLLTTHNMNEVEAICDRVGIMSQGRLIALDSPLALRQRHTERKVDVILTEGERLVFDLDRDEERRDSPS